MQFEHLFNPVKIGNKTARNRIIFPCHGVGAPFPEYIAYQAARAKGGCALNIIGPCTIHPSGGLDGHPIETPEMLIPKWKQMAAAVHEYGTLILVQLWHAGDKSEGLSKKMSWGASENPVNNDMDRTIVPHAMTDREINEVIDGYVNYAKAARDAGMDGVEIHGAHGYLPPQFWSPWINHRTDKWGEPLAFIAELITRIKAAAGKDFLLSVRMAADDLYPGPGGMGIEQSQKLARALEASGHVDLLHISVGHGGNSNAYVIGSMYVPPASISVPMASAIKQVVKSVPIIAGGRINDPALAEKAIADGHCDMVGLVRGQIADPEFSNKAREGRVEDIRLCIGCNQGCVVEGRPKCTQNLAASREATEIGVIKPAAIRKKVIVIGGGPAGMEAARVTALRGHQVTLYEKESRLGGLINVLSLAPGREEFNQVTRWLSLQLPKVGVNVKLNTEASVETVGREKPDVVITATGGRPYVEPVAGAETSQVVSPVQVLLGQVKPGRKAIVYECTGYQEGPTVADYLGEHGVEVELITSQTHIASRWGVTVGILTTGNPFIWQRLKKNHVTITPVAQIKKIEGRRVKVVDAYAGDETTREDIDTVVMCTGYFPNNSLYQSLEGKVKELYMAGDCITPKRAMDAIHSGYLTAFYI